MHEIIETKGKNMNNLHKQKIVILLAVISTLMGTGEAWTQGCGMDAPYVPDEHTLLLLHFDDTYQTVSGEMPMTASGTDFKVGVFGSGVLINDIDSLVYSAIGKLSADRGAIEFWVRPNWNGIDGKNHRFVQGSGIQITKDAANNFRFLLNGDDSEAHQAWNLRSWVAGEWHHIGVTWSIPGEMKTYIDGVLRISHPSSAQDLLSPLPATLTIGRQYDWTVDGVIDEFRISDIVRSCEGPTAPTVECTGFQPPMASGPVTAKGPRALPLKAQLFDADGFEMTDLELVAPPVLQVIFTPASGGEAFDVTDDALPVGFGTEGNQFEYNFADQAWQYNLKTSDYTAAGTYTITMVPGDDSEYIVDPTCEAVFERPE